eukprot:3274731-Amphidinium_carterae.1
MAFVLKTHRPHMMLDSAEKLKAGLKATLKDGKLSPQSQWSGWRSSLRTAFTPIALHFVASWVNDAPLGQLLSGDHLMH